MTVLEYFLRVCRAESRPHAAQTAEGWFCVPKTRPAYAEQFRREAVELCRRGRSIPDVAASLGVPAQSLRNWASQAAIDRQERDDGLTTAEREELKSSASASRLTEEREHPQDATASLRGRPRPGERLPAYLGQEGHRASRLLDVRAAGRL
jgi:transposase-like protein